MTFLKNTWYVAMWAQDLAPGAIAARRITDIPMAIFRREDGSIAAMVDSCPHRFAPLSLGKLLPGDVLRCPYHGLEFDSRGACVRNPHASGRIPPAARVRAFTAIERHSLIWVWPGDREADPASIPDFTLLDEADPARTSKRDVLRMEANYLLIVENLLDLSHASFLHEGILGNEDTIPAEIRVSQFGSRLTVSRFMRNVRVPALYDLMFRRDGGRGDIWADMTWQAPACLINYTGVTDVGAEREDGAWLHGVHFLTPETETTTLYHFSAVRGVPRGGANPMDDEVRRAMTDLRRIAFEDQDGVIIAAQQRNLVDPGVDTDLPALLEVDAGAVRFRRILRDMIQRDGADAPDPATLAEAAGGSHAGL